MTRDPGILKLAWPLEMRAGDERCVKEGVVVESQGARIRLRFLLGPSLQVVGPYCVAPNTFEPPPARTRLTYPLKFLASNAIATESRVDLLVVVSRIRRRWSALAVFALLLVLLVLPSVLQLRPSAVSLSVELMRAISISVPAVFVVSVLLAWSRVHSTLRSFAWKEYDVEEVVAVVGEDVAHIDLVRGEASTAIGDYTVSADDG